MRHMRPLILLAAVLALAAPVVARAQNVALAGVLGGKALLVIDNSPPRALAAGETYAGVRIISVGHDEAVVELGGNKGQRTLRLGETPAVVSAPGGSQRLVLKADVRGHFISAGYINGQSMRYMVDTGATTIAIGQSEARRMGIKYERGALVTMSTANGTAQGWRVRLDSVRTGELELHNVDAIVTPQSMPYVLLGNSYLRAFQMNRAGDEMVLQQNQ